MSCRGTLGPEMDLLSPPSGVTDLLSFEDPLLERQASLANLRSGPNDAVKLIPLLFGHLQNVTPHIKT